jgi:hypothetical protein
MKKFYILLIINLLGLLSCERSENALQPNAEVISFNPEKCLCCWGWTIKIGDVFIKSADGIIGDAVGYEITKPVEVYMELGNLERICSDSGFPENNSIDYHKVLSIRVIK